MKHEAKSICVQKTDKHKKARVKEIKSTEVLKSFARPVLLLRAPNVPFLCSPSKIRRMMLKNNEKSQIRDPVVRPTQGLNSDVGTDLREREKRANPLDNERFYYEFLASCRRINEGPRGIKVIPIRFLHATPAETQTFCALLFWRKVRWRARSEGLMEGNLDVAEISRMRIGSRVCAVDC